MRLVDKYLLRSFLGPLIYCLFIFVALYMIVDLFGHLDEIIKERVGLPMLILYYLAYLPSVTVQTLPIATLIATMYTLGNFARHNEITALRSSGIGLWNILKPFLLTATFISCLVLVATDSFVPHATQLYLRIKEERIEKKKRAGPSAKVVRDVALYGQGNKIIFARSYDPKTKVLKDIIIHQHDRRQNITSKIIAKEARWTGKGWIAFSIATYTLDRDGDIKGEPAFEHRNILPIKESPQEFESQKYTTETLSAGELRSSIRRLAGTSSLILQNLLIESHTRTAQPFANIIAVLIGAAFCLRTRRSRRLLGIGLGFLIGLLFYGVGAVALALGRGGMVGPFFAAWASNSIFGILGIYFINRY